MKKWYSKNINVPKGGKPKFEKSAKHNETKMNILTHRKLSYQMGVPENVN